MATSLMSPSEPNAPQVPWRRNLAVCWLGSFLTAAGMSLVMPFLPLYIAQLGVHAVGAIEIWSGVSFGATFLLAAFMAPVYGRLADRYGRKLMLLRASLGMAVVFALTGAVQNVWQLALLRFLMGAVSGYVSTATILVATQAPRERSGWALGLLSTGYVSGALLGPLFGGFLAETIGLRHIFWLTGALLFLTFLLTWLFVQETWQPHRAEPPSRRDVWRMAKNPAAIWALFVSACLLQVTSFAIEPIVTVYVQALSHSTAHVPLIAGLVVGATGVATLGAAPLLGRLTDRVGARSVLVGALIATALVTVPQAFVHTPWQLLGWRFMMGVTSAALAPAMGARLRELVPEEVSGRFFGYQQSAQYVGNISGPLMGGVLAAHAGIPAVFLTTGGLLLVNALGVVAFEARSRRLNAAT
ncbi:MAG TPA: MFS transporter [Stenomitos sp.]